MEKNLVRLHGSLDSKAKWTANISQTIPNYIETEMDLAAPTQKVLHLYFKSY